MSSLKNEDLKKMREIYGDNLINDIINNKDPSVKYFGMIQKLQIVMYF